MTAHGSKDRAWQIAVAEASVSIRSKGGCRLAASVLLYARRCTGAAFVVASTTLPVANAQADLYSNVTGYAALRPGGDVKDNRFSIVYDSSVGHLALDAPEGTLLRWINIESSSGIFSGAQPQLCTFECDNHILSFSEFGRNFGSRSFGNVAEPFMEELFLQQDLTVTGMLASGDEIGEVDLVYLGVARGPLQAGDADMDFDFDQFDLVRVQAAGKYLTALSATWGEGDWDGGPGGAPGMPPTGNGLFDQLDIIAAITGGFYLAGPYAAVASGGVKGTDSGVIESFAGGGDLGNIDRVHVPEPTTFRVFVVGILVSGLRRLRRKFF